MNLEPLYICYALAAIVSFGGALALTPLVRSVCRRYGLVDAPDAHRKIQKSAVALGGGVAVVLAMVLAITSVGAFAYSQDILRFGSHAAVAFLVSLLAAAVGVVALGVLDDKTELRGRYKLIGQIGIVALLVFAGLRIDDFVVFGWRVNLGWAAIPFTFFWLVGSTNAINLMDGIDGLASSIGFVLCASLAAINIWLGNKSEAIIMLALAGALLGFLRYNFNPASIYLGDAGSMLIGLIIGAVAIRSSTKGSAAVALAVPLTVWSVPILDSFAAILRRKLTGRSIFAADRGHFHHSLLVRGWSVRQASMFIALVCAMTCLGAVMSFVYQREWIALATVLFVMTFLVFTETFGHIEFALLKERFHRSARSLTQSKQVQGKARSVRLQGSLPWDELWDAMVESTDRYHLTRLKFSISVPRLHEAYFANWESQQKPAEASEVWRLNYPLLVDGATVGSIELSGVSPNDGLSTAVHIAQVLDFLEPIEDRIREIRGPLPGAQAPDTDDTTVDSQRGAVERDGAVTQVVAGTQAGASPVA
ncbi:WecA-like glycosyltransferase [Pirellulimonas nuda]|uniref:WecA-like glycosyltransferase n=1 Tax=Pirellulimonas nuda TaxID=2528009 RepID=A0A518DJ57_9BACT|nr:MraY family glycosyltransferase [Pirellulimonas nuda]QDU91503.1 WecA-like glycosyltransferase [Pirellulimonas nuda]